MAYIVTVQDSEGRGLDSLLIAHHCYLLPDGTEMPILPEVAWCLTCRRFTAVERLPAAEEREREVADWYRARLEDQPAAFVRDAIKMALKGMRAWFEWRAGRQSPPRFLECGAADFVPIAEWGKSVPHPAKPGTIRVSCNGHASMGTHEKLYTPEGFRIDQKATHGTASAGP